MMTILAIPFDNSSTDLKGHNVGDERFDQTTGKWYKLQKLDTDLTGDTTAAGQVALVAGTAGQVTQKVANGIDATNPVAAGVFAGACAESASASAYNYAWVQIAGPCTVNKDGNSIAVGDVIQADASTAGGCKALADATSVTGAILKASMGIALAGALAGDATVSANLRFLR